MKNRIKMVGKLLIVGLSIVILSFFLYSLAVIYNARDYTISTVLPDFKVSRWRPFQGNPIDFGVQKGDIPDHFIQLLLKVEDPGFYSHNGIDFSTPGAGLTTITQAIVKKLYFNDFKSGFMKLKQSLIARFVVNRMISKDDQITLFLNSMFFGMIDNSPQVGLQNAARGYFQKDARNLSKDEFISIVAAIVSPNTFNPRAHPEWNKLRSDRIRKLDSGEYSPKGLMDQYYGKLPQDIIDSGLPMASYFPSLYNDE